jgi:hypothetical protein
MEKEPMGWPELRIYNYRGRKLTGAECARLGKMSKQLFSYRLKAGYSVALAIETPVGTMQRRCSVCRKQGHYGSTCPRRG